MITAKLLRSSFNAFRIHSNVLRPGEGLELAWATACPIRLRSRQGGEGGDANALPELSHNALPIPTHRPSATVIFVLSTMHNPMPTVPAGGRRPLGGEGGGGGDRCTNLSQIGMWSLAASLGSSYSESFNTANLPRDGRWGPHLLLPGAAFVPGRDINSRRGPLYSQTRAFLGPRSVLTWLVRPSASIPRSDASRLLGQ
jgi:hypothetical protein